MSQMKVRAALEQRLALFAASKSLPVVWENKSTDPTTSHLRATMIVAPVKNPSMGVAGDGRAHQRYNGLFRIQALLTDLNKGPASIEGLAEEIAAWFPRGSSFVQDTVTVNIDNTPMSSGINYDGLFIFVSIDIPYRADVY